MTAPDLMGHAQALLDANLYLTLGTTGTDGRPWTSPVCFAAAGVREYYWVSATDAQHSRNLAERPDISLVVFDSTVAPYHGRAVYALGTPARCPATIWTQVWPCTPEPTNEAEA
jgi:Pyridoxamine 5'-phosphate oxidase